MLLPLLNRPRYLDPFRRFVHVPSPLAARKNADPEIFYSVYCLAFSPDGRQLASGSSTSDATIRIWDLAPEALRLENPGIKVIDGPRQHRERSDIRSLLFSPDHKRLVSNSWSKRLKFWNCVSCKPIDTLSENFEALAMAFSPDSKWLAAGEYGKISEYGDILRLWKSESGNLVFRIRAGEFSIATGKQIAEHLFSFSESSNSLTHSRWSEEGKIDSALCSGVAFLDNDRLACTFRRYRDVFVDRNLAKIQICDVSDGRAISTHIDHVQDGGGHGEVITGSPVGPRLAKGLLDHSIRIAHLATEEVTDLVGHMDKINVLAFSNSGNLLASCSRDQSIQIW